MKSLTAGLVQDTERLIEIQNRYYRRHFELWGDFAPTASSPEAAQPAPAADRRFAGPEWREHAWFQYLARSYLLTGEWLMELVATCAGRDPDAIATRVEEAALLSQDGRPKDDIAVLVLRVAE